MNRVIKLRKGLDLSLAGQAKGFVQDNKLSTTFAVKPTDFIGIRPKLSVKVGDEVKAGDPLFFDKNNEAVQFCSPVSGEVVEINRGAKRVLEEIVVLADKKIAFKKFDTKSAVDEGQDSVKNALLSSGVWAHIKERPFNRVANPASNPKGIFISCFNSAPLSADENVVVDEDKEAFQTGINALSKLTEGNVHLGLPYGESVSSVFEGTMNAEKNYFEGKHPAGNVGVQIHHINPINKDDVVYTLTPQDVLVVGRLFLNGIYDTSKVVALCGSSFKENKYIKTYSGAQIKSFTENGLKEGDNRIISGNILSGEAVNADSYLGFYDNTITSIPEGKESEFLGWLLPTYERPSASRAFVWLKRLFAKGRADGFNVNANMHGEERAYVVSEQYDKVVPMDIMPTQLMKSIMANDIDKMEQLGIYELVEEDMALCEFVCTSKIPVQKILRDGLTFIEKEA